MNRLSALSVFRCYPLILFALILAAYHVIFGPFFSVGGARGNGIGHDFSGILPIYLDGYYWFLNNGFLAPPWFTPAFCAGQPCFADPQSLFYSPGQFLTFLTDPLTASYLSLIGFSAAGYWGMYHFCRSQFLAAPLPATLAAALWILNGFSTHHYLVGHVNFVAVLLAPLVACLLLPVRQEGRLALAGRAGLAALVLFACLHAGLGSLMIPFALSIWGLACLSAIHRDRSRVFYALSAATGLLATGLAAGKLIAAGSLMANFPRSQYRLPGIGDLGELITSAALMLFNADEDIFGTVAPRFINRDVGLGPHEMAFNVTFIPLALIAAALAMVLLRPNKMTQRPNFQQTSHLCLLLLIVACPLAVNYYSPDWNAFLKTLPILASTTSPWRWFIVWIPLLCAGTAVALHALLRHNDAFRGSVALAALVALLALEDSLPRGFYQDQPYDPLPILTAYEKARQPGFQPAIRFIGTYRDENGESVATAHQNDLIVQGISQAFCYNPLFGYSLENFPIGTLRPGNPLRAKDGILNLKNPACYVFPKENGCQPGDHFRDTPEDRLRAEQFLNYRPWPFNKPRRQELAETVTDLSFVLALMLIFAGIVDRIRARRH